MNKRQRAAKYLRKVGALHVLDRVWGKERLTVLAYHRIVDTASPSFFGYKPVVSATPEMFERQMAYVARHFNVITLAMLDDFVRQGKVLPPKPLLITFDDGYIDNDENALPILQKHNLPAVIFLVTSRMDNPAPLWWDVCAGYFHQTEQTEANLPLLQQSEFPDEAARNRVCDQMMRQLKTLPNEEKLATLPRIAQALGVSAEDAQPSLFVSWDQVREMMQKGITFQPHTIDHPILTRVSQEEARHQIAESTARVEEETGQKVVMFAYPNGTPGDYDAHTLRVLHELAIPMAVTLSPGPMRIDAVRQHPLEIKRVYLGQGDTFDLFLMKLMGAPALLERTPYIEG